MPKKKEDKIIYEKIDDESKVMFKAAAHYILSAFLKVLPVISQEQRASINAEIILYVSNYGRLWIMFMNESMSILNLFEFANSEKSSKAREFWDNMTMIQKAIFIYDRAFNPEVSVNIRIPPGRLKAVRLEINKGNLPPLLFTSIAEMGDVFLSRYINETIVAVKMSHDDHYINLVDSTLSAVETENNKRRAELIKQKSMQRGRLNPSTKEIAKKTLEIEISDEQYKNLEIVINKLTGIALGPFYVIPEGFSLPSKYFMNSATMEQMDLTVDSIISVLIIFINEHAGVIFKDRAERIKNDPVALRENNFSFKMTMDDYIEARMMLFDHRYQEITELIDPEHSASLQVLSKKFINENKDMILPLLKQLNSNLSTVVK